MCLNQKANTMKISCPPNKITRIVKAFYGYSWSGDCHFIEKDCIVDVPNDDLSCLGEGCTVKIIESPIVLQECWHLMASYIQIDYECISVEQLQNMCAVQESDFSVGYIVTPDYPSTLASELSCPCTMQAPPGHTITIEVLDFRLSGCSQTGLTLWSDTSTYTHCLSIATGILPGSGSQNVSMRLHSQTKKNNAGFLLKYYASPFGDNVKIKFVCYGSAQIWAANQVNSISSLNPNITYKPVITTSSYDFDDSRTSRDDFFNSHHVKNQSNEIFVYDAPTRKPSRTTRRQFDVTRQLSTTHQSIYNTRGGPNNNSNERLSNRTISVGNTKLFYSLFV